MPTATVGLAMSFLIAMDPDDVVYLFESTSETEVTVHNVMYYDLERSDLYVVALYDLIDEERVDNTVANLIEFLRDLNQDAEILVSTDGTFQDVYRIASFGRRRGRTTVFFDPGDRIGSLDEAVRPPSGEVSAREFGGIE